MTVTDSLPSNETDRLHALQRYDILDTPPEQAFDDITRLAAQICQTPTALISLVDADRQWFKSKVGLTVPETPRDVAFCERVILERHLLIVPDACQDDRFANNPLVIGDPKIRFYVGTPLITPDDFALGTLCAIDYVPRELSPQQLEALEILARQVVTQLELRRNLVTLQQAYQQQQQTELALQQSQERYRCLVTELETMVAERTSELVSINQQLCSEIVERHRAEEEVRLLQNIIQAIGDSQNFHAALGVALRQICEFTGWNYGEAWIPNAEGDTLVSSHAWYGKQYNVESFRNSSKKFKFSPGVGSIGYVWSSQQPDWIPNLEDETEMAIVRSHLAQAAGLKASLAIPIVADRAADKPEVLAVIAFFMSESCAEDKRQVEIVLTVATQLGALMQRKRAEEGLRESEARYCAVVKQTAEGIFLVDIETKRILEANDAFASFLGYSPAQLLQLTLYDIVAFDRLTIDRNAQQTLRKKNIFLGKVPHRRSDGSIAYAEVYVNAIFYGGKEVFCIVAHDVTERQQVEEALRQSEERLQAILDNSTALIYVKDLAGKYLTINAWYGIVFHLDRIEAIGKTDYEIFPKEIADVLRINDRKVLETKTALDWEEILPHDDGLHTYLSVKFPLFNAAGEPYAVGGISTDITERKRAEEALRSSLATNRALINAMPDLMFRISGDGTYVNYKASREEELLLSPNLFLGKRVDEVMLPEVAEPTMYYIQQALTTGELQIFEYQLCIEDELRDYEARIVVSAEDEVMAIVRNITDRKRAEAEMHHTLAKEKELSELKSRFVTMTSHEFRTPLTTILSSAELMEDFGSQWSEEKKLLHLRRIVTTVKHMNQLLDDVLLIGKAEAGKLKCNPTTLDVVQFCCDLVEEMQMIADSHTIHLNSQCESSDVALDEKLLRQILINLLSNAIKYSPANSIVNFDLITEAEKVIFRVQDRGIGIPKSEQEHLFQSFYRASNVDTISGTGLGLAIVKRAVDLHGGEIAVESEVGVGTTFVVSLPGKFCFLTTD
jgi:PAS domain S-box-containing protein